MSPTSECGVDRPVRPGRGTSYRGYTLSPARCGGVKVRSRHGLELTATCDGRVALVTWPTIEAAMAAIDASMEAPS